MIEVYKHDEKAKLPTRAHAMDAGLDLYALEDNAVPLGSTVVIDTGISVNIPEGYVGLIQDRSSLAAKGLRTGAGVIDAGYNGRIKIVLHNITNSEDTVLETYDDFTTLASRGYNVKAGSKVAQLLIVPVDTTGIMETRYLWDSKRGSAGFGSTGT